MRTVNRAYSSGFCGEPRHVARRILVVDDEAPIARLIKVLLIREGYEVAIASDGEEAWTSIQRQPPELVLLDVNMPLLSGLEVRARARAAAATADLPIVMLTGNAEDLPSTGREAEGIDQALPKPFDPTDLIALVKRLLPG